MYMYGNTKSAFTTEPIDEYLQTLVGMKCSWSLASVVVFRPDLPRGESRAGQNRSRWSQTSASDRKATATNQMHSSDLEAFGKKCCYFWFIPQSNF